MKKPYQDPIREYREPLRFTNPTEDLTLNYLRRWRKSVLEQGHGQRGMYYRVIVPERCIQRLYDLPGVLSWTQTKRAEVLRRMFAVVECFIIEVEGA